MGESRDEDSNSPYAGRWVARLQGRIIAHGGTPEQAQRAAQNSRYKERAEISYMPHTFGFAVPPLVDAVRNILLNQELYLVGGAVRDALLGHVSHDLDFAVPENAIGLARRVADALGADFYVMDQAFDVARVIVAGEGRADTVITEAAEPPKQGRDFLDFTSFRPAKDGLQNRRRAPGHVTTLEDDLRGRDFTINAIAYDLRAGTILDPLGGGADLRGKIIRRCSPTAMHDDPIRVLRGVRLAAALDFKIEKATRDAMKEAVSRLPAVSGERQRDELFKILDGKRPDAALRALEMLGVFPHMMPELAAVKGVEQSPPHVKDVWEHTLSVMQYLEGLLQALVPNLAAEKNNDLFTGLLSVRLGRYREQFAAHFAASLNPERSIRALLFFTALYHDVSKPAVKSVDETGRIRFLGHEGAGADVAAERARTFNLSNGEVERVHTIIANHMRFPFHGRLLEQGEQLPSRKAIYRFFRDTGEAAVDLLLLGLADLRGVRGSTLTQEAWSQALDVTRLLLENYWERPQETVSPPRLLNGNEAMDELALMPGPLLGELLAAIREAQAVGEVSTREQAIAFGREWLNKRG
jgi:tRNA nucleotidyltransferase/poly(A) polymerase